MDKNNSKMLSVGKALTLSLLDNGLAVIKFDLEGSKLNKLSTSVMNEFESALDLLAQIDGVRGLVIVSGKKDIFFAGADLEEVVQIQTMSPTVAFQATERGKAVFAKLEKLPFRTVAAIQGKCLGGGTELALACSHRVASDDRETRIGLPEVGLGFIPGWGGMVRLPKLIGVQSALELILAPLKTWDANKAWRSGLVSELVAPEQLFDRACAIALGAKPKSYRQPLKTRATRVALEQKWVAALVLAVLGALAGGLIGAGLGGVSGLFSGGFVSGAITGATWLSSIVGALAAVYGAKVPLGLQFARKQATAGVMKETKGNLPAPLAAVKLALAAFEMPAEKAYKLESSTFAQLCTTEISRNFVRLHFLTQGGKKLEGKVVKKVAVLGCGTMGAGIVQLAANSGFKVVARDPFPGAIEKGQATVKGLFDKMVEKKLITSAEAAERFANITFVKDDYTALSDCDLVIEAVLEDTAMKQAVYLEVEKVVRPDCIIATNTSSLSVTQLGSCLADASRFAGLHFFNPVHAMKFVEVIKGDKTTDVVANTLQNFAGKLGKVTRPFGDSAGFVVNRILAPYMYEAVKLLEEGVPAEDIEKAMTKFGMPMGPFVLMDEVGLDICANVVKVMNGKLGDRVKPTQLLEFVVKNKILGKKTSKGMYVYNDAGKPAGFNPEITAQVNKAPVKMKLEQIQDRMVLAMVNEAALCISESVADEADDVNVAMILGTGWAPFHGGPLRYVDRVGARVLLQKLETLHQATGDDNYKPADLIRKLASSGERFCK